MISGIWKLGHRPALDGLRAIAVLLVLLCHGFVPWFLWAGGAVGVSVFFTLSGFLITTLLIQDREAVGRVRFVRFYLRRVRRLAPALFVVLVVSAPIGLAVGGLHWQAFAATIGYCSNWVDAIHGPLSGDVLGHTWSLAIEEQFYIIWPVVFGLLARRSTGLVVAVGVAVCAFSLVERLVLYDPSLADNWRTYFGTDTRADGLMYGCLLAVAMSRLRTERPRPELVMIGLAGIAWATALRAGPLSVFGPTVVSLATCAVIFGAAQGARSSALEARPLVWIGKRSYGVYLWHASVAAIVGSTIGRDWYIYAPVMIAGTLVVAALSWRFIESPFLHRDSSVTTRLRTDA